MRIHCKGCREYDGEFHCEYEPLDFDCDDCIINGGTMSPVSNKPFRGNPEPYIEAARERCD